MSLGDKISGRAKKAAGDLTDNAALREQGRNEEAKGEAKEQAALAQEEARAKADEAARLERET